MKRVMNRVLIDTNVWVDIVLKRPQFFDESFGAVLACAEEGDRMLVAATSVKDVFYWAAKSAGAQAGYSALAMLFETAEVAAMDGPVCERAIDLERPDYEDGMIAACALAESVNLILTRDETAFCNIGIPKLTPHEYLEGLGYEPIRL